MLVALGIIAFLATGKTHKADNTPPAPTTNTAVNTPAAPLLPPAAAAASRCAARACRDHGQRNDDACRHHEQRHDDDHAECNDPDA